MVHKESSVADDLCPGEHGKNCPWNGCAEDKECRCDECDWFLACFPDWQDEDFYQRLQKNI